MPADSSLFDSLVAILLRFWPQLGLVLGMALMVMSRFRWRPLCTSVGMITLAICIGALVSRN